MLTKPLVIVGSGNGGRITLDIARALGFAIRGFVSPDLAKGQLVNGVPVLGNDDLLEENDFIAQNSFAISIGIQSTRRTLAVRLLERGGDLPTLIHPSCVISEHVSIGEGTILVPGVIVNCDAAIGRFCIINAAATIEHDCVLRDGTLISPGVHFGGSTTCDEGAFIGIGACTIAGIRIGKNAIVGAGAVVIKDVPEGDVVVGNPARTIKKQS